MDNIQNQSHQKAIIRQKDPQGKNAFGNIKKWLLVLLDNWVNLKPKLTIKEVLKWSSKIKD